MSDRSPNNSGSRPVRRSISGSLARVNRTNSDLEKNANGNGRKLMTAPSAERPGRTKSRPKRTHSFKRTSVAPGAIQSHMDTEQLAATGAASLDNSFSSMNRSRDSSVTRSQQNLAHATAAATTFGTTTFVKNFLEEDDDHGLVTSLKRDGSPNALQFDAETQRNVHRSLLSTGTSSPRSSPENSRSLMGSLHNRSSHHRDSGGGVAPPQNLFKQRDDFYNVDQSVNLMDAEAGKYESKNSGKTGGASASMVEIFLKETANVTTTATGGDSSKKRGGWFRYPHQAHWDRMSTWEKTKDICARLIVPLFCCAILAVVVFIIVLVYDVSTGEIEITIPTLPPLPEHIELPVLTNTEGMTESMQAMGQELVQLRVVTPEALQDQTSAPFKALDWVSTDEIALQALPSPGRRLAFFNNNEVLSASQERLIQRYVLAVLYYTWGGKIATPHQLNAGAFANMNNLAGSMDAASHAKWLTPSNECTWTGVGCHTTSFLLPSGNNEGTHIRALNLTRTGLKGTLPREVTSLTHLVELDLRHNHLSGDLNDLDWKNWKRMEYLLLGGNTMTGSIPEDISEMTRIIDIDLGDNKFSGSIPALTNGQIKLEDLENLFLDTNGLTGTLPESFVRDMPNLVYMDLTNNQLKGPIPAALGELSELRYFRAVNNSLTGKLPKQMAGLVRLDTLALDNNQLEGKLPSGVISGMTRLRYLQMNNNGFSGPLPGGADKLKFIHLAKNRFSGPIPSSWFEGEKALLSVRLGDNKLTGEIPKEIGNVAGTLEDFRVEKNDLLGELPEEMGELKELRHCKMSSNGFTGPIPDSWGGMVQIEELFLYQNSLTGSVPNDLCELETKNEGTTLPVAIKVDCATGDIKCDCCQCV